VQYNNFLPIQFVLRFTGLCTKTLQKYLKLLMTLIRRLKRSNDRLNQRMYLKCDFR